MNAIFMGNHSASFFDFMALGSINDYLDRCDKNFVLTKKSMLYFPMVGWVELFTPHSVIMSRSWEKDKTTIADLCRQVKADVDYKLVSPWLFNIFPEGTRFTEKKLLSAQEFAKKRGFPVYNNL